jgi:UDP-N-acetylmuramate: L-alanyl-gamma-D-glutamyl-meso-diaminopimelate ligase
VPQNKFTKDFKKDPNWVHITGIGGITTGQLAVALTEQGFQVTGSDEMIYEPMKSHLGQYSQIKIHKGYSYSNLLDKNTLPGLVVVNGGLSLKNKEYLFAKKQEIPIKNYAQVLEERCVVKDSSIVVAGSFGKSTVSSLLVHIFKSLAIEISYMFGGKMTSIENAVKLKNASTKFSIIEGDEYFSARFDRVSKFFHYHPKYLVLTGYAYDHADFFSTPEEYFENFSNLVRKMPEDGLVVFNQKFPELERLANLAKCKSIGYEYNPEDEDYDYRSNLIGDFNKENILAAITLLQNLELNSIGEDNEDKIRQAIKSYPGLFRRLEIKLKKDNLLIIDDFGSTPGKAKKALETVRKEHNQANIIAIFEPNLGSRQKSIIEDFKDTFEEADTLVLNQFTETQMSSALTQSEFEDYLKDKVASIRSVSDKNNPLLETIKPMIDEERLNVILFLSSHGVEKQISQLKKAL